ncbi:hypothetical protein COLO4_21799 [Corchorus olitorius]|uniref:Uncharacterized protein n=1 Tax=Corchorus olitorius TaxID=93759 RepID=A0A1R3IQN6_9ROSI|nr:hypothetical protein COLO4_21799 [Corchorus olitorius]
MANVAALESALYAASTFSFNIPGKGASQNTTTCSKFSPEFTTPLSNCRLTLATKIAGVNKPTGEN